MGTTTSGLPYPEPTDPVAGGAAAIRALAEGIEPRFVNTTGDTMTGNLNMATTVDLYLTIDKGKITVVRNLGTWATDFGNSCIVVQNNGPAGTHKTAGISFLNAGAYVPQLRATEEHGDRLDVVGSAGTSSAVISASQFLVVSSENVKSDIAAVSVLDKVGQLHASTFRLVAPLDTVDGDMLHEHDCGTDPCTGTADAPCSARVNHDSPQYGLIAEQVAEVFPEAVSLDRDMHPEGIHVNQIAAIALGALSEMCAKVAALETRLTELESP